MMTNGEVAARAARWGAIGLVAAAALAGCGGSGSGTDPATGTAGAAADGGPGRRDVDPAQMQKIRECLTAAGISIPTPTGTRTFDPSHRPSDRPTFTPGTAPSGRPGVPADGRGLFSDPRVRAALEACGIGAPTGRPSGAPADPSSSGVPTSPPTAG